MNRKKWKEVQEQLINKRFLSKAPVHSPSLTCFSSTCFPAFPRAPPAPAPVPPPRTSVHVDTTSWRTRYVYIIFLIMSPSFPPPFPPSSTSWCSWSSSVISCTSPATSTRGGRQRRHSSLSLNHPTLSPSARYCWKTLRYRERQRELIIIIIITTFSSSLPMHYYWQHRHSPN